MSFYQKYHISRFWSNNIFLLIFRFPYDTQIASDISGIVPADCGGRGHRRCTIFLHRCRRLAANTQHILLLYAATDNTGCRILYAKSHVLR